MREIKYIVLHCTATPKSISVKSIQNYWRHYLRWKNPGYHFIIENDGSIIQLQDISKPSNGVKGYNRNAIHISYIGGQFKDDRSTEQKIALEGIVKTLHSVYPKAKILGHRDFSGVKKACPNFEVKDFLKEINL